MARRGPIIVIDDDEDDRELMAEVFKSINVINELKYFDNCIEAYEYLSNTNDKPFVIFSDFNLPIMSGAEFKRKINANDQLRRKSIPFVFLTTSSSHELVLESYDILAQGFFTKPLNFDALKHMVEMILNYWKVCRHPNTDLM
jgi:CheY-like chemotaxis protein